MIVTALVLAILALPLALLMKVWWLLRRLPPLPGLQLSFVWRANPLECLRARAALAASPADDAAWRHHYGVYTRHGENLAALRQEYLRDLACLSPVLDGSGSRPRAIVALSVSPWGYHRRLSAWMAVGCVVRMPGAASTRDFPRGGGRCVFDGYVDGDDLLLAGGWGRGEPLANEALARERLPALPAAMRDALLLHRVNTGVRRDGYAGLFAGAEIDVVWNGADFEVNHPPMRPTGLPLASLLAGMPCRFLWLDWKNPDPASMAAASARLAVLLAGRDHLVELPIDYFRAGGALPAAGSLRFSVYLPVKEIRRLGNAPGALAAEINGLLARWPQLDGSFDSDLLPWVRRHTQCGTRHGIYSWYLESLSSAHAWRRMCARQAQLQRFGDAVGARRVKCIVKLHTLYY